MSVSLLIAGGAGLSTTLLVLGLLRPSPRAAVLRRLFDPRQAQARPPGESFAERVLLPFVTVLGRTAASYLPGGLQRRLDARLEQAGMRIPVARFTTYWAAIGVLLPLTAFLVSVAVRGGAPPRSLVALVAWVVAGVALPWLWLRRRGARRTFEIDRALSDAMDLIVTNVESGVGLQAAMINVAQKYPAPLGPEFSRTIREISLGRSAQEALDAMARRSGSRELALFARAIAQAERNGLPVARVLRGQAEELRERRRQLARERANTFPLRITLLTVVFIFPTLFLLILGPVALGVAEYFRG